MKIFAVVVLALVAVASASPIIGGLLGGSKAGGGGLLGGLLGGSGSGSASSSSSSSSASSSTSSSSSGGLLGGVLGGGGGGGGLIGGLLGGGGSGGLIGGIVGTATGLVGGVVGAATGIAGGLLTTVTGLAGGLVQSATAVAGGVIKTAIGLVDGAVGVLGGLTLLAGGLVAGVVGALSQVLSGLLIAFTEVLTKFDVTGILKSVIEVFSQSVVAITSCVSFFGGSTGSGSSGSNTNVSGSSGSNTNVSGSSGSNTNVSGSSGNGSFDFVRGTMRKLQVILKYIFSFKNHADFNIQATIVDLADIVLELTVTLGAKITAAIVQVFKQLLAQIQAGVTAYAAKDFSTAAKIAGQILNSLIILLDLVVPVCVNISAGIKGASAAVADAFNVSIGLLFGVLSALFTTVQTFAVAAQGNLYQFIQGASDADQAAVKPTLIAVANLIDLCQIVCVQTGSFLASGTIFIKDSASIVSVDFSLKLSNVVSSFLETFAKIVLQVFGAFSSVIGINANGLGQICSSVFRGLNIVNEANYSLQTIGRSGITVQTGIAGIMSQSSAAGGSFVGSSGGSTQTIAYQTYSG